MKVKYPRTKHLPHSPGATSDDKILKDTSCFNDKTIIITEKMDGENSTLYNDHYHARSLDSRDHSSRSWIKQFHASIKNDIPIGWRVCGENMYAKHSIEYNDLKSYFYCFSIWDDTNYCLSWHDTVEFCQLLNIEHVKVFKTLVWDELAIKEFKIDSDKEEGYVVRNSDGFLYKDFGDNVAKFVRPNHVQPNAKHWFRSTLETNKLSTPTTKIRPIP